MKSFHFIPDDPDALKNLSEEPRKGFRLRRRVFVMRMGHCTVMSGVSRTYKDEIQCRRLTALAGFQRVLLESSSAVTFSVTFLSSYTQEYFLARIAAEAKIAPPRISMK